MFVLKLPFENPFMHAYGNNTNKRKLFKNYFPYSLFLILTFMKLKKQLDKTMSIIGQLKLKEARENSK